MVYFTNESVYVVLVVSSLFVSALVEMVVFEEITTQVHNSEATRSIDCNFIVTYDLLLQFFQGRCKHSSSIAL
jgi:hypothetical protein